MDKIGLFFTVILSSQAKKKLTKIKTRDRKIKKDMYAPQRWTRKLIINATFDSLLREVNL